MSPSLRQFMLVSIIGMTVLLASLLYFHVALSRGYMQEHLATHSRNLAIVLRNSLLADGLGEALKASPEVFTEGVRANIDARLDEELRWVPVVKVKVYSPDATVLYSSSADEIGLDATRNKGVQSALAGQALADLVKRDRLNELDGSVDKVDLHQQYIPIKDPDNGRIVGVFEIYTDVSRIISQVDDKQRTIFWSIAGILGVFYLALTLLFLRTHRSLQYERQQREQHLRDLQAIRAELEQRVTDRTAELVKSRTFLQSVIDGIGSPLLVIRPDFTISLMNRAARKLLPKGRPESDFQYCYQVSHRRDEPCSGEDHPCSFSQVMRHGRPARVRHTHYDANDQPIIVDLLSTPLYSADGEFEGVIEVEHDVTQIVRMQAGLVESEARLQAIMDHVPDAIFTCDADCVIRSTNPSALRMFHADALALVGRPLDTLLLGEGLTPFEKPSVTLQKETAARRLDGGEFPVDVWIGPLDLAGERRYIAVVRDITARRQALEELEKTRQQYFHQEKMAAIGQLAAGILHEVGNPIAAIAGAASELKSVNACGNRPAAECPYDEAVARNIELIDQQTHRLGKITREIADFASPRLRERELLDLNSLLRSTARLLSYDKRFRDVRLDLDLDKGLPAIFGVADQLTQVFMNLLINAMDACSNEGASKGRIVIGSTRDDERVHVTISDNGAGMSEETLTHVMEPFFTTKAVGRGTGLGLSLCDTIATAHGGFLHIESEEGVGTTVHLFLPVSLPDDDNPAREEPH